VDHTVATPADRAIGRAAKRVSRTLVTAANSGYSETDVASLRRAMRRTGQRVNRRQLTHLLDLAAGSAA